MKKIEELKFMVDLNWRIRWEKMDHIFNNSTFVIQFNEFLNTVSGKKWLETEEGKKYQLWQQS